MTEKEIAAYLEQRADSYSRDARAFQDAGRLGRPIMGEPQDQAFSILYRIIAGELQLTATRLLSQDGLARASIADVMLTETDLERLATTWPAVTA